MPTAPQPPVPPPSGSSPTRRRRGDAALGEYPHTGDTTTTPTPRDPISNLVPILERLETSLVEGHPTQETRICGHDGCLVGVLESCPACLVRFGLPIEAGRFAHLTTTP